MNVPTGSAAADPEIRAWWDTDLEEPDVEELVQRDAGKDTQLESPPSGSDKEFVHLHVHSEYSLLDGLSPVYELVNQAKRQGMRSLAITDHGNLYGAVDFYAAATAAGVKPIVGVEAYVSPRGMADRAGTQDRSSFHLVLLAKDLEGYANLLQLVTRANLDGYYYKPRVDRDLLAQHSRGLIALSGCYNGEPSRAILDGNPEKARKAAAWYREVFGEDYFLELQDHGNADDRTVNQGLLDLHRSLDIPIVATNDSHYALPGQADAQDILLCVQTNSTIDDPKRMRMQPAAFYVKSADEMWQLFQETPDALKNTLAIAERCNLQLQFDRLNFPALDHLVPPGESPQAFLERTCRERLIQRYAARLTEAHSQRLEYELDVIKTTGFAAYILFVWDFVAWARQQGILCGPRGSAAGSIILYSLGISDIDPVGYGLTFERFLNPERAQMPDIDMDFADDRRDEVIQYVVDRYGRDRVAQIITFGRLLPRAAIRDVGRALSYPLSEVDRVAKLIPAIPVGLKIDQALEQNPELKRLYEGEPSVRRLIDTARSVQGVARHAGTHAAGVVVADQPLVNYVPLQKSSRGDSVMTQYHMKVLEKIGLLKMDFLGLANLTMLARALDNVRGIRGEEIDLWKLPPDDPNTYAMLSRGETKTVFQLEGSGMTRYIQDLKPSTVDHLAAMVALYRPGPMAHIPSYIARREGREPAVPPDPSLEEVLRESYGVIVFQDQVLQVVRKMAGYSLGEADVLRRAMGKKDKAVMEEEGPRFIAAAREHGYSQDTARRLWDLLQPFAGYAFNKAHAYCYAYLAYQTAYLKANYPVEWFAAVLTTVATDTDKIVGVVAESRRLGVDVLPPDVNRSAAEFTVEQVPLFDEEMKPAIRYGLNAIKNVGEGAVEVIVRERTESGPYRGLDDFCRRLDLHTMNRRVMESLTRCGALDAFGPREAVLQALDAAMGAAQIDQKAASAGQVSLFDGFGSDGDGSPSATVFALPAVAPLAARERALWEKEALGLTFEAHPFQAAEPWLRGRVTHDTSQITSELGGQKVVVAGVVTAVRKIFTKTKGQMAVLTLEDLHGSLSVVVFPRSFEKHPDHWQTNAILVIEGKVDTRDDHPQLLLERAEAWTPPAAGTPMPEQTDARRGHVAAPVESAAIPADQVPSPRLSLAGGGEGTRLASLRVLVPRQDDADCLRLLEQLHVLVEHNPGENCLALLLQDRAGSSVELVGAKIAVRHSSQLETQLRSLLGESNVAVTSP